jgi:hypothetical protein
MPTIEVGDDYVVLIDNYSGFIEDDRLQSSASSKEVICD